MQIDLSKVRKVYSGRPGCMCGCRGKWTYANEQAYRENFGDEVQVDHEDISERSVKIIAGKVQRDAGAKREDLGDGVVCYYVNGPRVLAVYTKE